jgi:hypothetical protein
MTLADDQTKRNRMSRLSEHLRIYRRYFEVVALLAS